MKHHKRLLAALLAVCVTAVLFSPFGFAAGTVHTLPSGGDLEALIKNSSVQNGDTIQIQGTPKVIQYSTDTPLVIEKELTIQGGNVEIGAGGIILGADVTFRDITLSFSGTVRNLIMANGHTLTLENVKCGNHSFDLFCGGFINSNQETLEAQMPSCGTKGTLIIKGTTTLQGDNSFGSGNIYAGNLCMGGMTVDTSDQNGPPNEYVGDAEIIIEGSASSTALGEIYACGAQRKNPEGPLATKRTIPDPENYTVSGRTLISGKVPHVNGGGTPTVDVQYSGGGNQANVNFNNISNLTVTAGNVALSQGSSLRDGATLSVASGAKLNVAELGNITVDRFIGGGSLILGKSQTLTVSGDVEGETEVTFNGQADTTMLGRTYLTAVKSSENAFRLGKLNIPAEWELKRDGNGNWSLQKSTTSPEETKVVRFEFENKEITGGSVDTEIREYLTVEYTTENPLPGLADMPYTIYVNGSEAELGDGNYLETDGLKWIDIDYGTNSQERFSATPKADGVYQIEITIPAEYSATGQPLTAAAKLTVGTPPAEKPDGPAAPANLAGTAPTSANGTDGKITGTTAAMEYSQNGNFTPAYDCGENETRNLSAGTYYVRYKETDDHKAGASALVTVPAYVDPTVTVQAISLKSTNHKTVYALNEPLDVSNLTITIHFSNNTTQDLAVTAGMVSGFDSSQTAEQQTLTITYQEKTTTYTIQITDSEPPVQPTVYQVTVQNSHAAETGAGSYPAGTEVRVQAGTYSGYTFAAWDASNTLALSEADRTRPDLRFQMPDHDVTLLAIWTKDTGSTTPPTPPAQHTHAWGTAWASNASHHWHNCTSSGCSITDPSQKNGYSAHTPGEWIIDQAATSSQSGRRHKECTACGYVTAQETIPAAGGSSGGGSSGGGSSDRPSSSGGGSSNSTTTKNPDGSSTTTTTNPNTGAVTQTTRNPDGSQITVETKKDGTVTSTEKAKDGSTVKTVKKPDGSSETTVKRADGVTAEVQTAPNGNAGAEVRFPAKLADEARKNGEKVSVPVPALPAEAGISSTVTIRTDSFQPLTVEIPLQRPAAGIVAAVVNADGTETILKTSLPTANGIVLPVSDGVSVKLLDNRKPFADTVNHWAGDAIDFVSARELFSGKTAETFAPDAPMTRAMWATVLARFDGADTTGSAYEKGIAWAKAHGVSDGANPNGPVTREQLITMLYRYTGSPAPADRSLNYTDAAAVSGYARDAMSWAVEAGILSGYADGTLAPGARTTRGQVAAMLMRYVTFLNA